jgi:tetratricopeptide (TPR) repeat protein
VTRSASAATRWLPVLLVAATLLAWHGSLEGAFVFDDLGHIVRNPELHSLARPGRLLTGTSRPLLKLSLAANYALGGLQVFGYHVVNLAIHVLAGLALFGVVRPTWRAPGRPRGAAPRAAAAPWLAAAVALLWLLHPLQTQAVTYVVQRGEALMGLAALTTLYCATRAAQGRRPHAWGAAAVLACALGMGSKEVMVVVPPLVLLHDRTFLAGSFAAALRRRPALYAGLAATWLVPFWLIGVETLFRGEFARPDLPTPGALEYALTQPRVVLHYLRLAVWPAPLCFDYGWPPARSAAEILPAALVVAAALLAGAWLLWRGSWLGFLAAWFFGILAPTSSFLPIQDLAVEHRMYLPLAAPIALVVVLGYAALAPAGRWRPWLGGAAVALLAIALGLATAARNRDYRDEVALWRSVVAAAPRNARAYYNLGTVLRRRGELDAAIAALRRSLELAPDRAPAHYNLANALKQRGDLDAAISHYRSALALSPGHGAARVNLANALRARGDDEEAIREYRRALESDPDDAAAHYNLAVALEARGHLDEAIAHYRRSLELRPASASAHNNLGNALRAQGDLDGAIEQYRLALAFDPRHARAHYNLGRALEQAGRGEQALEQYRKAVAIDPGYTRARERLEATAPEEAP